MVDQAIIREVVNTGLAYEQVNSDIVLSNLTKARNQIQKEVSKNPDMLGSTQYLSVLDRYLDEAQENINKGISPAIRDTLNEGAREGKFIVGSEAQVPKNDGYWGWTPVIPVEAVGLAESQMATLIRSTTKELKEKILRTVQIGLAGGMPLGDIQDAILGTGLKGLKGRDGVWRTATSRAEMQARTITNDLLNRGALITYHQVDQICPELKLRKVWQTVSDRRTSLRCLTLSGVIVGLKEDFKAGDGWSGSHPPSHPNCRSRVTVLSEKYSKEYEERFNSYNNPKHPINNPKYQAAIGSGRIKAPQSPVPLKKKEVRVPKDMVLGSLTSKDLENAINDLTEGNQPLRNRLKGVVGWSESRGDSFIFSNGKLSDKDIQNIIDTLKDKQTSQGAYSSLYKILTTDKNTPSMVNTGGNKVSAYEYTREVFNPKDALGHTARTWNFSVTRTDYYPTRSNVSNAESFKELRSAQDRKLKYNKMLDINRQKGLVSVPEVALPWHSVKHLDSKVSEDYLTVATLVHETGHRIHYRAMLNNLRVANPPPTWSAKDSPSNYGRFNPNNPDHDMTRKLEAFAESYAMYVFDPEFLKVSSPNAYTWVRNVIKEANR